MYGGTCVNRATRISAAGRQGFNMAHALCLEYVAVSSCRCYKSVMSLAVLPVQLDKLCPRGTFVVHVAVCEPRSTVHHASLHVSF